MESGLAVSRWISLRRIFFSEFSKLRFSVRRISWRRTGFCLDGFWFGPGCIPGSLVCWSIAWLWLMVFSSAGWFGHFGIGAWSVLVGIWFGLGSVSFWSGFVVLFSLVWVWRIVVLLLLRYPRSCMVGGVVALALCFFPTFCSRFFAYRPHVLVWLTSRASHLSLCLLDAPGCRVLLRFSRSTVFKAVPNGQ